MGAIDQLDSLKMHMPELFQDRQLSPAWDDGYILFPIEDPMALPDSFSGNKEEWIAERSPQTDHIDWESIEDGAPLSSEIQVSDSTLIEIFGGAHAGAPLPISPSWPIPPADSLAFYLPYHYYHPKWWGCYLRVEGVEYMAGEIRSRVADLPWRDARPVARLYLYFHEAFHHKTECFATRLEITHRKPLYKTGFERFYQNTVLTPACLEESLSEASALDEVAAKIKGHRRCLEIMRALTEIVSLAPPGYREGVGIRKPVFDERRCEFAEENQKISLPHLRATDWNVWSAATHLFHPISNIRSRVNYILPFDSPLASRLPMARTLMKPSEIRAKLKRLVGLKYLRHGKHPIYQTSSGKTVPIPNHGNIAQETLKRILNEVGLDMSIREFQKL